MADPPITVIQVRVGSIDVLNPNGLSRANRIGRVFQLLAPGDQTWRQNDGRPTLALVSGRRYRFTLARRLSHHIFYFSEAGSLGGAGLADAIDLGSDAVWTGDVVTRMGGGQGLRAGSVEFTAPEFNVSYNCSVVGHMGMGGLLTVGSQRLSCAVCSVPAEQGCAICKTTGYCGPAHQNIDWSAGHNLDCGARVSESRARDPWIVFTVPGSPDVSISLEWEGFAAFGRSETVSLQVPGGRVILILDPENPEVAQIRRPGHFEFASLVGLEVPKPLVRQPQLTFAGPPFQIKPLTEVFGLTGKQIPQDILQFFTHGQGFQPPRFQSTFFGRPLVLARNTEAPKTQYVRRLIMSAILDAAIPGNPEELARLFFSPYSGTAGGLGWSWPTIRTTMEENQRLFADSVETWVAGIDRWLGALGNVQ